MGRSFDEVQAELAANCQMRQAHTEFVAALETHTQTVVEVKVHHAGFDDAAAGKVSTAALLDLAHDRELELRAKAEALTAEALRAAGDDGGDQAVAGEDLAGA